MAQAKTRFATMEEYIASFPGDVRKVLQATRETDAGRRQTKVSARRPKAGRKPGRKAGA